MVYCPRRIYMKKALYTIAALSCAVSLAVGLSACSRDPDTRLAVDKEGKTVVERYGSCR